MNLSSSVRLLVLKFFFETVIILFLILENFA